jgi:hypothetical protein
MAVHHVYLNALCSPDLRVAYLFAQVHEIR